MRLIQFLRRGLELKMENILLHSMSVFMGFSAIMNPIANIPIFLGLTSDYDDATTKAVALKSLMLALLIVVVFSLAGKIIFQLFGITLPAFRITGGLLIFLIGFHMLQGNPSKIHHPSEDHMQASKEAALSVSVSPLAIPILAGPGTITTAMNFSAGGFVEMAVTISMFAILCAITYICFVFGEKFAVFIGAGALGAITRMMGLILAVIGTQMVIEGIQGAFTLTIQLTK